MGRWLTDDQRLTIIGLAFGGYTCERIALRLNVTRDMVKRALKKANVPIPKCDKQMAIAKFSADSFTKKNRGGC